jgi:hypothetical protein
MQGNNDEASIPMEDERNGERMSVRRKFANMLKYFNPFSTMPPPQDEDAPAAKRPRLQASDNSSTAEDAADSDIFLDAQTYSYMANDTLTASPDETVAVAPTITVTVAATSLPSSQASHAHTPRRKWNIEEDAKLAEAVKKLGKEWVGVAAMVTGRTNRQCRRRWVDSLDPDINTGKWTVKEDAKLTDAVKEHGGNDWTAVAAMVTGRTHIQCRYRWVDSVARAIKSGRWTVEEDSMLAEAVTEFGSSNWTAATVMVPGRTNKQCSNRWSKYLGPTINSVKWTVEEDAKLTDAVKEHGSNNWAAVAAMVPGRTDEQCRYRWAKNYLDPDGNRGKWTVEEEAKLIDAV